MIIKLILICIGIALMCIPVIRFIKAKAAEIQQKEAERNAKRYGERVPEPQESPGKSRFGKPVSIGVFILGIVFVMASFGVFQVPAIHTAHINMKLGKPLEGGQLIAFEGQRGQQAKLVTPGIYWDWKYPFLMDVEMVEDLVVPSGQFVVLKARDGRFNPNIAAEPWPEDVDPAKMLEDFQYFIDNNGQRGVQQYLLTTGNYRLNRFQWDIEHHKMTEINATEVLVIESKVGKAPPYIQTTDSSDMVIPLVPDRSFRGIVDESFTSGYYNVHPYTEVPHRVPVRLQTFVYGGGYTADVLNLTIDAENDKLITVKDDTRKPEPVGRDGPAFDAKTKDSHTVRIDVRVIGQIEPRDAPRFVGNIREIERLGDDFIEPYTRNILTNIVLEYDAIDLKNAKEELANRLSEELRERTAETGFQTKTVEVVHIDIPPIVLMPGKIATTSRDLESALKEKEKAVAQAVRVQNMQEQANQQSILAEQVVRNAAAVEEAQRIRTLADADKYREQQQADAAEYRAQAEADALLYRASKQAESSTMLSNVIGIENAAKILLQETVNSAAEKFNVPHILVNESGGSGNSGADIIGAYLISNSISGSASSGAVPGAAAQQQ